MGWIMDSITTKLIRQITANPFKQSLKSQNRQQNAKQAKQKPKEPPETSSPPGKYNTEHEEPCGGCGCNL